MKLEEEAHRSGYPAENKRKGGRTLRSKSGFTLIEVLIGASILAVGLLGLATIYPVAYLNVDSGGKLTEASTLSQAFIERLRTIGLTNFDAMAGDFPAGFNNMSTANCQGDPDCVAWRNALDLANGGQLPLGVGTVTIVCQDGVGAVQPCTPSQNTWIATVNVTVNWNDLRAPRTLILTTRILRP